MFSYGSYGFFIYLQEIVHLSEQQDFGAVQKMRTAGFNFANDRLEWVFD